MVTIHDKGKVNVLIVIIQASSMIFFETRKVLEIIYEIYFTYEYSSVEVKVFLCMAIRSMIVWL